MRFLADENFPKAAVLELRRAGHVVEWATELSPGASDDTVLKRATAGGAVLLTFDKDFGELARRAVASKGFGIVLFRIPLPPTRPGEALRQILESRSDWSGNFSVIEPSRIRMRPLTP